MTKQQAHNAFKIEVDKISVTASPSFISSEIDYWLDKAYENTIITKFTGHNQLKEAFEQTVKRVADLNKLISVISPSGGAGNYKNSYKFITPTNYWFYVSAAVKSGDNYVNIQPISHSEADRVRWTTDNKPWLSTYFATFNSSGIEVYYDPGSTITPSSIILEYVSKPTGYVTDAGESATVFTSVPDYMCREIITNAATLALENITSPRVQTQVINTQSVE
jgi:hypothetical protein